MDQFLRSSFGAADVEPGRESEDVVELLIERCCGLDVHRDRIVACLLVAVPGMKVKKEVKTFETRTHALLELRGWLEAAGCTHVGMESTGVYWKPVYAILEGSFDLTVGNAQHIKNVPGRKTDVKDSEWIADLLRHGLIRKSFVPPMPIRELRDLTRYRTVLAGAATTERNRLLKVLETVNIKLASVVSDVFGVSGTTMLRSLIRGEQTPTEMAQLARGRMRSKIPDLEEALAGLLTPHHREILELQLNRVLAADADIARIDELIEKRLEPYREQRERLTEIPGVESVIAATILAEVGADLKAFASEQHLAAWAGVCPGSYESAGKNRRGTIRKGNVHLRNALVQAAVCASRAKGTYLSDKYHRLRSRLGAKRAQVAIAHKILVSAYHVLKNGQHYKELGAAFLDELDKNRVITNLCKRIQRLGFDVQVSEKAA